MSVRNVQVMPNAALSESFDEESSRRCSGLLFFVQYEGTVKRK